MGLMSPTGLIGPMCRMSKLTAETSSIGFAKLSEPRIISMLSNLQQDHS